MHLPAYAAGGEGQSVDHQSTAMAIFERHHEQPEQPESHSCLHSLQEVGEHAHCGRGNVAASGFSYDPQSFMVVGIGVYNLSWRDMGVPSLHRILEIVQVGLLWENGSVAGFRAGLWRLLVFWGCGTCLQHDWPQLS